MQVLLREDRQTSSGRMTRVIERSLKVKLNGFEFPTLKRVSGFSNAKLLTQESLSFFLDFQFEKFKLETVR